MVKEKLRKCSATIRFSLQGDVWILMEKMDASLDVLCKNVFSRNLGMREDLIKHITYSVRGDVH